MRLSNEKPVLAALLLLVALLLPLTARSEYALAQNQPSDILRLHVIANSDSEADQSVKLLVRDALLAVMEPGESATAAKAFLLNNGALLQQTADDALLSNGFGYGAQLMLGTYPFPDRDYGGVTYPAGDYEALRVVLGNGAGRNWWCVLFPPLCILSEDAEAAEESGTSVEEADFAFESSILNWWRKLTCS